MVSSNTCTKFSGLMSAAALALIVMSAVTVTPSANAAAVHRAAEDDELSEREANYGIRCTFDTQCSDWNAQCVEGWCECVSPMIGIPGTEGVCTEWTVEACTSICQTYANATEHTVCGVAETLDDEPKEVSTSCNCQAGYVWESDDRSSFACVPDKETGDAADQTEAPSTPIENDNTDRDETGSSTTLRLDAAIQKVSDHTAGFPEVSECYLAQVVTKKNNVELLLDMGVTMEDALKQCYDHCLGLPKCDNYELVWDKLLCNFSQTGGTRASLKDDPDAAVFFIRNPEKEGRPTDVAPREGPLKCHMAQRN